MSGSDARRKRWVVRRSMIYLNQSLMEVEAIPNANEAHQHALRLSGLDAEFKTIQCNILHAIDEGDKSTLQESLEKHDEVIDELSVRIKLLFNRTGEASSDMKVFARSLASLERLYKWYTSRSSQ